MRYLTSYVKRSARAQQSGQPSACSSEQKIGLISRRSVLTCKWVSKCYSIAFFQPLFLTISNLLNFLMIFYAWMPATQHGVNTLIFLFVHLWLNWMFSSSECEFKYHLNAQKCLHSFSSMPVYCYTCVLSCSYSLSRKQRDGLSLCFVQSQSTKTTSVFELHVFSLSFFNTNLIFRDDFRFTYISACYLKDLSINLKWYS